MKLRLYNYTDLLLNTDGRACSMHWKQKDAYKILVRKSDYPTEPGTKGLIILK
jgi:hypothetical protein